MKKAKRSLKKLLAMALAAALFVGSLPSSAYAEGNDIPEAEAVVESTEEATEDVSSSEISDISGNEDIEDLDEEENIDLPDINEDIIIEESEEDLSSNEEGSYEDSIPMNVGKNLAFMGYLGPMRADNGNHTISTDPDIPWVGSYVYYGKFSLNGPSDLKPVKYRLIDTNNLLLDCNTTLVTDSYSAYDSATSWADSFIRSYLNGNEFLNKEGFFTDIEKLSLLNGAEGNQGLVGDEKVWILSYKDLFADHGYNVGGSIVKGGVLNHWWIRSENGPRFVDDKGHLSFDNEVVKPTDHHGVSPAINVDRSKVIYTNYIKANADSPYIKQNGAEYTFGLKDEGVSVQLNGRASKINGVITVPCEVIDNSEFSTPDYLVAAMVKKELKWNDETGWNYYGDNTPSGNIYQIEKIKINDLKNKGSISFKSDLDMSKYDLYVFAMESNSRLYETEYASAPVKIDNFYLSHENINRKEYVKRGNNSFDFAPNVEKGGFSSIAECIDADHIISGTPEIKNNSIVFDVKEDAALGKSATITVKVSNCDDYAEYTVTFKFTVAKKSIVTIGTRASTALEYITDPVTPSSAGDKWKGSYVYYGKYSSDAYGSCAPVRYRVLRKRDEKYKSGLFLDCETVLFDAPFDDDENMNTWRDSDIKRLLNGDDFYNNSDYFSQPERDAMTTFEATNSYYDSLAGDEKIILLRYDDELRNYGYWNGEDACASRIKYKYTDSSKPSSWWTRSRYSRYRSVHAIDINGQCRRDQDWFSPTYSKGISPAFVINTDAIVYSALIETSESTSAPKAGEAGAEYSLALRAAGLNIEITGPVIKEGDTVTVPCKVIDESDWADPDCVMIMETTGNYPKDETIFTQRIDIEEVRKNGKITFEETNGKSYFYIFALDERGICEADYASELKSVYIDKDKYTTIPVSSGVNSINLNDYNPKGWVNRIENIVDSDDIFAGTPTIDDNNNNLYFTIKEDAQFGKTATIEIYLGDKTKNPVQKLYITVNVSGKEITCLGTEGIGNPNEPLDEASGWSGNYVFYGHFNGSLTKYRVLANKTDEYNPETESDRRTLFLNADATLYSSAFNKDGRDADWLTSDIRAEINGDSFLNKEGVFNTVERDAIAESSIASYKRKYIDESYKKYMDYFEYTPLEKDKIFLLDLDDLSNPNYGYGSTYNSRARYRSDKYYTRSAFYYFNDRIYAGTSYIYRFNAESTDATKRVCPAFNVDLGNVVFSSLIKYTNETPAGNGGSEYNLTLKDTGLKIKATDAIKIDSKNKVTIPYSITDNSKISDPNTVVAVVTDGIWTKYGWSEGAKLLQTVKIKGLDFKKSGNITFSLKDDLPENYNIFIVAMDENPMYETDYSSEPTGVNLTANAVGYDGPYDGNPHAVKVDVTNPSKGVTVKFGTAEGVYNLTESPVITNVSESPLTVYYQISAKGYATKKGFVTLKIAKADAVLITDPTARTDVKYSDEPQALVNMGLAENGEIVYAVTKKDGEEPSKEAFSSAIPKATDAGEYTVWYYVKGDDNHKDTAIKKVDAKIDGTGQFAPTEKYYTYVPANKESKDLTFTLPDLPEGSDYSLVGTDINNTLFDGEPALNGNIVKFSTFSRPAGVESTIVLVAGGSDGNSTGHFVSLIVTVTDKSDASVKIKLPSKGIHYGDTGLKFDAEIKDPGTGNGECSWICDQPDILEVDKSTGKITVKKNGVAYITVTYSSDTTFGKDSVAITVKKKVLSLKWSDERSFAFDSKTHLPTAVIDGVLEGDNCELKLLGEQSKAGEGYIASATLIGDDAHKYILADDQFNCGFSISKTDIKDAIVSLAESLTYNGREQTQNVSVMVGDNDISSEFTIKYNIATNAGSYILTIVAKEDGSCTGSQKLEYTIAKKHATPVIEVDGTYKFSGSPIIPEFRVVDPEINTVIDPADYSFEITDNINAGTGKIIVTPLESLNYIFEAIEGEFTIEVAPTSPSYMTVVRYYPYDVEIHDSFDLLMYLPEGCGDVTDFSSEDYFNSYNTQKFVNDIKPTITGNIVSYALTPTVTGKPEEGLGNNLYFYFGLENYKYRTRIQLQLSRVETGLVVAGDEDNPSQYSKTIVSGQSITLRPTLKGETVNNRKFSFSSSNPDVATVSQDGKVTGLSAGYTLITASSEYNLGELKTQFGIFVTEPVNNISLDKKSYSFGIGESVTLNAGITPFTADHSLVWTSNNENVSLVPSDDGLSVVVTGAKAGKATVTATAADGSKKKAVCSFVIGNAVPDFSISAKNNTSILAVRKKLSMFVSWNEKIKPANSKLVWSVVNAVDGTDASDIASISDKGVLTGKKEGCVKIVAVSSANPLKKAESAPVNIYVPIKSVSLNRTAGVISTYAFSHPLKLSVNISSGVTGIAPTGVSLSEAPEITWSRDEKYKDILSVSSDGIVTAGNVTGKDIPVKVTVKAYNGYEKTLTCKITVKKENSLKAFKLSKSKLSLGVGNKASLSGIFTPVNPDGDMSITWESSDSSVATVDSDGTITAIKQGSATIKATTVGTVIKKGKKVNLSSTCKVTVTPSVQTITFTNGDSLTAKGLNKGKTYTLKTKFKLSGKGKAATKGLSFSSSDEKIATVTQKGVIKAIAPGTVTITAVSTDERVSGDNPSVSITFNVYSPVTKLALDKTKLTLGTQYGCQYGKVNLSVVAPPDTTDPSIIWKVNNKNVVLSVIDEDDNPAKAYYKPGCNSVTTGAGKTVGIKALIPGVVKLTGVTADGSKKKVTCSITVRGQITALALKSQFAKKGVNDVTFVSNTEYTGNMKAKGSLTLKPMIDINGVSALSTVKADKTLYKNYKKYTDTSVSYRSSNTNIATVSKSGKISISKNAKKGDTVTILITTADGKNNISYTITVVK